MTLDTQNNSTNIPHHATGVAGKVFEVLAARLRPQGICVVLLEADGRVARFDDEAAEFFQRYVHPEIQDDTEAAGVLAARSAKMTAQSPADVWSLLPGTLTALLPIVEKRLRIGAVALMARDNAFSATEDVQRICGRQKLDAQWLVQQASGLPGYDQRSLQAQAQVVSAMMGDQLRMDEFAQELDSLSGQLAGTYEELSLVYQISSGMRITRRPADFFRQTCMDVLEVMSLRGIGVVLHQAISDGQDPTLYGAASLPQELLRKLGKQIFSTLAERKSTLLLNNVSASPEYAWLSEHAHELLAVPMQWEDRVLGCLFALDKTQGEFDSVDSKLLQSIASESAIYLQNALLFEDVHGLMMGLLHSLTSAVDAKDAYTCGHSERVALLSRHLSQQAGLTDHDVERVYMAGLLHDVGKIGVPEHVLQKTGKLTTEEFDLMKKHPEIGARILRDIKQISDIIPGVLYHHERWDGKGYPSGLAGENIPRMGRIICLADCFDAMTSNRTYRKALPLEVALDEIQRSAGTQFDPTLAQAFLSIGAEKLREIGRTHDEQAQKLIDLQKSLRGR